MNKCFLMGRLTKDPELRTTQNGKSVCSFTIAVDRKFLNAQGNREADFLPCVAWNQTAEFVNKYFGRGRKIAVTGSIQTRNYDAQDGSKRYVTEIIVEEVDFADSKNDSQSAAPSAPAQYAPSPAPAPAQMNEGLTEEDDDELPF